MGEAIADVEAALSDVEDVAVEAAMEVFVCKQPLPGSRALTDLLLIPFAANIRGCCCKSLHRAH